MFITERSSSSILPSHSCPSPSLEMVSEESRRQGVSTRPSPDERQCLPHLPILSGCQGDDIRNGKAGHWANFMLPLIWWVRLGMSWGGKKDYYWEHGLKLEALPPTCFVTLQVIWYLDFHFLIYKMQILIEPTPRVWWGVNEEIK